MIQGIQGTQAYQQIRAMTYAERQQIKDEFLAIFYKELLKQTFKPPKLGMSGNENSVMGTFSADILLNQMALELAQSNSFSADNLFPQHFQESAGFLERKIVPE